MIRSTVAAIVAPRRLNLRQALNLNQPQSRRKWSSQRPHPLRPQCLPRKWHQRRRHDRESATPVHPDRNWGRHYPLPNTSKPLHGARGLPVVAQTALQIRRVLPRQHRRHRLGSGTHPWSSGVIALHITLHHHHSAERNPRALCGSRLCTSRLQYRKLRQLRHDDPLPAMQPPGISRRHGVHLASLRKRRLQRESQHSTRLVRCLHPRRQSPKRPTRDH